MPHIQQYLCKQYRKFLVITSTISHNPQKKRRKPSLVRCYCWFFFLFSLLIPYRIIFCSLFLPQQKLVVIETHHGIWYNVLLKWISLLLAIGEMQMKLNECLVTALQSPLHSSLECHAPTVVLWYICDLLIINFSTLANFMTKWIFQACTRKKTHLIMWNVQTTKLNWNCDAHSIQIVHFNMLPLMLRICVEQA